MQGVDRLGAPCGGLGHREVDVARHGSRVR